MKYSFTRLLAFMLFMAGPFVASRAIGQEKAKPPVKLTEGQWKTVEGFFRNPHNEEMVVQFSGVKDTLQARLLWNNAVIPFTPESDLQFLGKSEDGGPFRVNFIKDSSGGVNGVSIGNGETWPREKNYKPVIKTEMAHTPEQLKPFEGLFQLKERPEQHIQFTVRGNSLVLKQHWDGEEVSFVPQSELVFFSRQAPVFALDFTKGPDGTISQARAFKRDIWIRTVKKAPTSAQLKSYEGKYRFKDDPDNLVQLVARGNDLVVRQLWDGKETVVQPQTETYFYNDQRSYPLQIGLDKDGKVIRLTILGMDEFSPVAQ
ncbi:MAG: hypothetical protein Q8927_04835 [Bacteroidota bacterium]|nr:hypothetical protein [Bacteroidota bacterium]MDP4215504.1 hypothetical protein [Bacteroidota bacterium]MDP4246321.1 hypothetical protein [Bacteroidota bacterium]MDP4253087.1 hypothetical protein [Bacteroidota bacterium]MDP4259808.1 hypothetical protein [Bacteroidota bacterium]